MKTANLKTISDDLKKYDYCAKEDSFISITEWENGEGYKIYKINKKEASYAKYEFF